MQHVSLRSWPVRMKFPHKFNIIWFAESDMTITAKLLAEMFNMTDDGIHSKRFPIRYKSCEPFDNIHKLTTSSGSKGTRNANYLYTYVFFKKIGIHTSTTCLIVRVCAYFSLTHSQPRYVRARAQHRRIYSSFDILLFSDFERGVHEWESVWAGERMNDRTN